jgi:hypothetical protein
MCGIPEIERRAQLYWGAGRVREALACYERLLAEGEDPMRNALRRWEAWMYLGEFDRAWQESDRYEGSREVAGRVLVRCCRGLGDAIQFLRFLPQLAKKCSYVAVEAPERLVPLFGFFENRASAGIAAVSADPRQFDMEVECSDLPYVLRVRADHLAFAVPYIRIPDDRIDRRRQTLPGRDCLRIGVAWAAGEWNRSRSIPLRLLLCLADVPGVQLFSVQRGAGAELELYRRGSAILDTEETDSDITHTATTIAALDLVITVDTMIAHLAGALGRPVWTLLQYFADWRWMLDREDTPWYPTMRLFRQSRRGNWKSAVDEVMAALRKL